MFFDKSKFWLNHKINWQNCRYLAKENTRSMMEDYIQCPPQINVCDGGGYLQLLQEELVPNLTILYSCPLQGDVANMILTRFCKTYPWMFGCSIDYFLWKYLNSKVSKRKWALDEHNMHSKNRQGSHLKNSRLGYIKFGTHCMHF